MKNLLCVATGMGALSGLNAFAQIGQQPNVVIIVADDLGYGDLSCYGATRIQTLGMDRIANEGLRFTQGYFTAATNDRVPCILIENGKGGGLEPKRLRQMMMTFEKQKRETGMITNY